MRAGPGHRVLVVVAFGLVTLAVSVLHLAAGQPAVPLKDFIGINGHTVQFRPQQYRPVGRLVRDYHPVEWDLGTNSALLPPFPLAKNGVDWRQVYGSWGTNGWRVDVSLMFETLNRSNWVNVSADARAYGHDFAQTFGPSGTLKLVESVEIGNEPGKWSDADYAQMLEAMAGGLRAGDPALRIATCNLTAGKSSDYEKSVGCVTGSLALIDVLTIHTYAQLEGWPTWRRSFPEDPRLHHYLQDVEALCRWRDAHAPEKPVWITEFGYDSSSKSPPPDSDSAKWIGVTDSQQAQWLVRSILVFSALPVQRAYVYFFNDDDRPSLHASSGITRHFQPKPSFHGLAHLQQILGDYHFTRLVTDEPGRLRVQEYQSEPNRIAWVAWSRTGEGKQFTASLGRAPGRLLAAQRMPLTSPAVPDPSAAAQLPDGRLTVLVDESPVYLIFEKPPAQ